MSLLEELKKLKKEINEVFESELPWETKYSLIFSKRLSGRVYEFIDLDYYDPDTTYQEDVTAFVEAFNDKCQGLDVPSDNGW